MPYRVLHGNGELYAFADVAALRTGLPPRSREVLPLPAAMALRRAYYAAVSFVDFQIGRLLRAVDSASFGNRTLTLFCSDHGFHLGEGGLWGKHYNLEHALHTPALLRVPGQTDGGRVMHEFTEHVDLMPTLAQLAGLEPIATCPVHKGGGLSKRGGGGGVVDLPRSVPLCTMGRSLAYLVDGSGSGDGERRIGGGAAFSQHPGEPAGRARESSCLSRPCTMGYSLVTRVGAATCRYTDWVRGDSASRSVGRSRDVGGGAWGAGRATDWAGGVGA